MPASAGMTGLLERALDLLDLEALDHIALPHVLIAFEGHAAFLARHHLAHFVLEAFERGKLALMHDDVVADQPDLRATLDFALGHAAARDFAHFRDGKHFEDFGVAEEGFAQGRREQTRHGLLHLVNEIVDHGVIPDLNALALGHFPRLRVGAHVEAEHHRARGCGERHVGLSNAAHARVIDAGLDLVAADLVECRRDRFDRTLHVAFDDDGKLLDARLFQLVHHLLEAAAGAGCGKPLAPLAHPVVGNFAGAGLVLDHGELVSGLGRRIEAEHLDRNRGTGFLHVLADIVEQSPHAAPGLARDDEIAEPKRAALDQSRADRTAAPFELRLDDDAFGGTVGIGGKLEQLGLQQDRLEQLVEAGLLQRRDLDFERVAAEAFHHDFVAQEVGADPLRIGARLVDLVDGDDEGNARRFGVIYRFDRLRLHAVVGGDHQDHDVGDLGAAGAHGGEGLVARRIDEGDLGPGRRLYLVGADMLGDAAGLLRDDVGCADRVEQRGLAVIDMAHDGDHGRAWLAILGLVLLADEALLDVGLGDAPHGVPEFLGDELGGVGVDHIGDLAHFAVLHQIFDDVNAPLGHAVGELLNGDDFGNDDVALDFRLCQRAGDLLLLALLATLERSETALALFLIEGIDDREPASDPALFAAPRGDRALLVTRIGRARGLVRLFLDKMLARGLFADLPRLGLGLVPFVLFALAVVGVLALFRPLLFVDDLKGRGFLRFLAFGGLALARLGERAHARVLLLLGELRQHDANAGRLRVLGFRFGFFGRGRRRDGFCLFLGG